MNKLFIVGVIALILSACSANEQQSRETFKEVERNTGKVIGNAGEIVGAGVDALDKSWETPGEQRRKAATSTDMTTEEQE